MTRRLPDEHEAIEGAGIAAATAVSFLGQMAASREFAAAADKHLRVRNLST
jgi:hypothetical protein